VLSTAGPLTIVGGDRERLVVAHRALLGGPSTPPLDVRVAMAWLFPESLASGFLYIVPLSALSAWVGAKALRLPGVALWLCAALVPPILSYALYWGPYWLGSTSDQAELWAPVAIAPWSAAGILAFTLTLRLAKLRSADTAGRTSNNRWRGP
jgi:hypothetical protein